MRDELIARDFTIDPTFNIYVASRDLMRERRADWHEQYTMPALWQFFEPNRANHGGRVTVGSDSGYIYQTYGFGTIQELELLREAGFHPLEVLRAATLNGAQALGEEDELGTVEAGKLADLAILDQNPLANLKVLYGTGHIRMNANGALQRVGGVVYTLKDGILFDARELRADVRRMVAEDKAKRGITALPQPGGEPL